MTSAEQKRRFTMKKGFETLEALLNGEISGQGGSSGPKMSKAAVLNKAKVQKLHNFNVFKTLQLRTISSKLRGIKNDWKLKLIWWRGRQITYKLNSIKHKNNYRQTVSKVFLFIIILKLKIGLPLAKPSNNKVMAKFSDYVAEQTRQNYKFYVFSRIMKRLFETYTTVVSTSDQRQLRSSTNQWVDVQCRYSW